MQDLEEAIITGREALQHTPKDHLRRALCSKDLGFLYTLKNCISIAEELYQQAIAEYDEALGPGHTSTLQTVKCLGMLQMGEGECAKAEQTFQRALNRCEKLLGSNHVSTLETINNLGTLYADQGRLAEAEQMYERALTGKEKALGPEHTSTLDTINNLGSLYAAHGRLAEAEQMYERALTGKEKALGPEHASTLETVNNLGLLYADQDKHRNAQNIHNSFIDNHSSDSRPLGGLPAAEQAAFNAPARRYDPFCSAGTRLEVLEELKTWAYDETDKRGIFWLSGMAGTGKSTIARTIARKFSSEGHLGASFFFSYGEDFANSKLFITTIAKQLATSTQLNVMGSEALQASICKVVSDCPDIGHKSWQEQWEALILSPIKQLGSRPRLLGLLDRVFGHRSASRTLIIVIDALDECEDDEDIKRILQLLAQLQGLSALRLRVILSSRPDIVDRLGSQAVPAMAYRQFVLEHVSKSTIDDDIHIFLKRKFDMMRHRHGALPISWPGNDTIEFLVQQADGLFIWAATYSSKSSSADR
ncbi:hypothetical protein D6D04_10868 [Aureobasidium pullulans]|nr:hypothetical protein D6D04_10868 [Aureobasidium pullulans]